MARRRSDDWTRNELAILDRLDGPRAIQDFVDRLAYNTDSHARSPRGVLQTRRAHCFGGALFAAAALRRLGHPPLLVDLRAVDDDDHVLAIFRKRGHIGAVAKSNFVGLRFREPVYRTLRELLMSYFEMYYNMDGRKSLREYSVPLDLRRFDAQRWMVSPDAIDPIAEALDSSRHYSLLTRGMIRALGDIDRRSYEAGMLGTDLAGVYWPTG